MRSPSSARLLRVPRGASSSGASGRRHAAVAQREREPDARRLPIALGPDTAPVGLDHRTGDGQTDARPAVATAGPDGSTR